MQDNVTQADRDRAFSTGLRLSKRQWIEVYAAFAAHRLASTAQPEVKGLVEALEREAKKAAEMAAYAVKHDFDAMGEALDNMRHRLEAALAAYHEAQP
jgi:hypothetical protein